MATAGSIVVDLLCRTAQFETDTKRAEKRLAELKKEAQAMGVAVGAAFTAVAAASAAMVKSSIDAMDEMSKMAQKVGTSVESLSALAYAADLAGVGHEQLGAAMVKLSKNMSDAAMGTGEAAKGFDALGISIKNSDGTLKSTDQVLGEVAEKFAGYRDGAEKTALAVNLFGKAGAELIPLLNGGKEGLDQLRTEAERLGVVLDTETSKAAETFNDNLTRLHAATTGLANRAAGELLPALIDVTNMLIESGKQEDSVALKTGVMTAAIGGLINIFQTVAVVGSDVAFVFQGVGREIGAWAAQIAALARGDLAGFHAISDAVKADGERARAELDKFQAQVMAIGSGSGLDDEARRRLGRGVRPALGAAPGMKKDGAGGGGKDADADFKSYLNNLQLQIQKTEELTASEKLLDDIRRGALTVTPKQQEQLATLTASIDKEKELTEHVKWRRQAFLDEYDAAKKAREESGALLQRLLDTGPAAQLEKQRKEMQLLADEFQRFVDTGGKTGISEAQYLDAVTGNLNLVAEKLPEAKSLTEELGLTFASAFENAIVGGGHLSDIFKGLLQDVVRLIVRMQVIEPMMKQLKESMGGGGGGGGGLGSIFSSLIGGGGGSPGAGFSSDAALSSFVAGMRADGGPVDAGKAYIVGERRPEVFVPRTAGMILPSVPNGGGAVSIVNQTTGRVDKVVERRMPDGERMLILQEVRAMMAGDASDPTSKFGMSLRGTYNLSRSMA